HRGRAVRRHDVGNQSHGVAEVCFARKQVRERTFGQSAVTDFTPPGTAQEFHFTDAERRKIVVQHEALELVLLEKQIETLHVFFGAKGYRSECLRFTPGEERRAVNARKQTNFAGNLANLIEGPAIRTAASV